LSARNLAVVLRKISNLRLNHDFWGSKVSQGNTVAVNRSGGKVKPSFGDL